MRRQPGGIRHEDGATLPFQLEVQLQQPAKVLIPEFAGRLAYPSVSCNQYRKALQIPHLRGRAISFAEP